MQRTLRLKLDTTPEQKAVLRRTLEGFTQSFNFVCEYGWKNAEKNGVELHKATYKTVKALVVDLPSQLICASVFAKAKKDKGKKVSQPRSKLCPIRYDQRSYWVNWDTNTVSLATTSGRQKITFVVPHYATHYTGYPVDSADLIYRKGNFWLHVVVTLPTPDVTSNGEAVGVDLGLTHPAVTSNRQFLGKKHWKEVDRRYFRIGRALQAKGTKSARKHLRKLAGRKLRFRRDCDHVLSKRIVQSVNPGTTIVIENLTDIRKRTKQRNREGRRRMHSWSFAQIRGFIEYKAEERAIKVVAIDPRHTSQTCSKCGYQSRSNRSSQSQFLCRECGYELNADLNAAYNIRNKHLASLGMSLAGGSPSTDLSYPLTRLPVREVQAVCFS
jgi:putative transposase